MDARFRGHDGGARQTGPWERRGFCGTSGGFAGIDGVCGKAKQGLGSKKPFAQYLQNRADLMKKN